MGMTVFMASGLMSDTSFHTAPELAPVPRPGACVFGLDETLLAELACPLTGEPLHLHDGFLVNASDTQSYVIDEQGIPLFAQAAASAAGKVQQIHYDRIAAAYSENLTYPHTQEYMIYLDNALREAVGGRPLGEVAEICCGLGEAMRLFKHRVTHGVGVDISLAMLHRCQKEHPGGEFHLVQADATLLPIRPSQFDTVFMLGGIHHVMDREKLFAEVHRVLKPGGLFIFREPVSDFWPWRAIRTVVYRFSSLLDADTERPLLWSETVPPLEKAGFEVTHWSTHGLLGFMIFMNSDILVFNRLFRFLPGIRALTRLATRLDALMLKLPGMGRKGLQVIGVAKAKTAPAVGSI